MHNHDQVGKFKSPFDFLNHLFDPSATYIEDPSIYQGLIFPIVKILSNSEDFIYIAEEVNNYMYSPEQVYTILFTLLPKRKRFIKGPTKNKHIDTIKAVAAKYNSTLEVAAEICYLLTADEQKIILRDFNRKSKK